MRPITSMCLPEPLSTQPMPAARLCFPTLLALLSAPTHRRSQRAVPTDPPSTSTTQPRRRLHQTLCLATIGPYHHYRRHPKPVTTDQQPPTPANAIYPSLQNIITMIRTMPPRKRLDMTAYHRPLPRPHASSPEPEKEERL